MKTIVRRSQRAFFYARPVNPLPLPDPLLVALQCPPAGALAGPVELAQDAPHVVRVVAHAGPVLDEVAHPPRGPQPGGKAERLGAALKRALEVAQLGRAELRRTTGTCGLAQAAHAGFVKFPRPAANRLAVDAQLACDRGLAKPLSQ
jgi:hypothetical protein